MLSHVIPFIPQEDEAAFARLPDAPGVFLLSTHDRAAEPFAGRTADLRRRIKRLLAPPETQSKRLNLREQCAEIAWRETGSEFETRLAFYQLLRDRFPSDYAKRMRLKPAALIRIHWENAYPRAYVTRKLGRIAAPGDDARRSVYFGPFVSRAIADHALNSMLDLFLSRRCTFELHPDPSFPGCVYSEMKMCLAPCYKGCSDERYMQEVLRVQSFLESHGDSLRTELEAERDRASAELRFEEAASLHNRIEKAKEAARALDEVVCRIDRLDAVVLQKTGDSGHAAIFRFAGGEWVGPSLLDIHVEQEERSAVLKQRFLDCLVGISQPEYFDPRTASEQLALLKRWYYSSRRAGEIFFRNEDGSWPLQRMVNGVTRLFEDPKPLHG